MNEPPNTSTVQRQKNNMGEIILICGSTQIELKKRLKENPDLEHLYWIQALEQTEGRGRQSRDWVSPAGNFYFSFLIRGPKERITWIPHFVALSLWRTMTAIGVPVDRLKIKWPNDLVWVDGAPQKIAGLLVEKIGNHFVVGVGVNLNFIPFVQDQAVSSLKAITGKEILLDIFRDKFLKEFKKDVSHAELVKEYSSLSLFKPGDLLEWSDGMGVFSEIGSHGELIVVLPGGETKTLFSEDVRSLRSKL